MKLCFVHLSLLVMALLTELPGSALSFSNGDGNNFTDSQGDVCASLPGLEECLWARVALLADRAAASNVSARLGGVSLVRLPEDAAAGGGERQSRGARALLEEARAGATGRDRLQRLRELAGGAVLRFLRSRALRVRLPDGRTYKGAQRRLKKMLYPFLAGIVLKAAAALPLVLAALLGVGLKALLASNVALAITAGLALRTFLFSDSGGGGGGAKLSTSYHHAFPVHHEPLYHYSAEQSHAHAQYAHPEPPYGHSAQAGDIGAAVGSPQPYPYGRAMPGVDRLGWTPVAADRISEDNWSPLDVGLWRHSIPYDQTDHGMSQPTHDYDAYSVTSFPSITSPFPASNDENRGHNDQLTISAAAQGTESAPNLADSREINAVSLSSGI
ncbi:uncharacterized protein LOC126354718 [Schistocerca gregaria]|uniref:uncharacterized protein LOC126354718 n=1 Tax=Schistocerca gregaria TaxID=7010 RepID=UPI00211E855E|nr:uncharacterized protein LOC126354718 [Schistocerca gregaria]